MPSETHKLRVFISWSGPRAEIVAKAFHEFLPDVVNVIQPFLSGSDIDKGTRWREVLADTLQESSCAIVCLTRDSLDSLWVAFETGAISRATGGPDGAKARIWTYLLDVTPRDLELTPFAEYQATKPTEEDTFLLIRSVNKLSPDSVPPESLSRKFHKVFWPSFSPQLQQALNVHRDSEVQAPDADSVLSEILRTVRSIQEVIFTQGISHRVFEVQEGISTIIATLITSELNNRGWVVPVHSVSSGPDHREFRILTGGKAFSFPVEAILSREGLSNLVQTVFGSFVSEARGHGA